MAAKTSRGSSEHFERTSLSWILLVTFFIGLFTVIVVTPDVIRSRGTVLTYLVDNHAGSLLVIYILWWMIHVGEGLYSISLCRQKAITGMAMAKWGIQTILIGYPSLRLLIAYQPQKVKRT
uniref:transmembrane protein 254-like n=1 Tax=Myxine glutinosa TaxID=7769 RepID=UPI00358F8564